MNNNVIIVCNGIVGMACARAFLQQITSVRVTDRVANLQDAVAPIEQHMALGETP